MIEAVLFDFNGVIADDEEQHRAALGAVLGEAGLSLTREQYYSDFLGFDDRSCVIEDSLPGLRAARAAGMHCTMLTTSHTHVALAGAGADLVWSSFAGHDPAELLALAAR